LATFLPFYEKAAKKFDRCFFRLLGFLKGHFCVLRLKFYLVSNTAQLRHMQCCQVLIRLVRHFNKNIPLFGKNTPLAHIFKKFRYFSAISSHFSHFNFEKNRTFSLNSTVLSCLLVQISSEQNYSIFPLLFDELMAVPLSRFRRF
jgi:hypothetical protein